MPFAYLPVMAQNSAPRACSCSPRAGVVPAYGTAGCSQDRTAEIVFPRTALAASAQSGAIGAIAPFHFMGGVRAHQQIENELAPPQAAELEKSKVDLALLVPY